MLARALAAARDLHTTVIAAVDDLTMFHIGFLPQVGVIGLCFFELRRLGKVDSIAIAGTNGTKFPGIRKHLKDNISDV